MTKGTGYILRNRGTGSAGVFGMRGIEGGISGGGGGGGPAAPSWTSPGVGNWVFNGLGAGNYVVTDKSGNSNTATDGTATLTYHAAAINGKGAVSGNGTSTVMSLLSNIVLTGPFICYWIGKSVNGKMQACTNNANGAIIENRGDVLLFETNTTGDCYVPVTTTAQDFWWYIRRDSSNNVYGATKDLAETLLSNDTNPLAGTATFNQLLAFTIVPQYSDAGVQRAEIYLDNTNHSPTTIATDLAGYIQPVYGF